MSTLLFPKHTKQTNNDNVQRAEFVAHYATMAGIKVQRVENNQKVFVNRKVYGTGWVPDKGNILSVEYNGKQVIFEFSDFPTLGREWMEPFSHLPIFKFHYDEEMYKDMPNVFPIGPCMVLPSGLDGFERYFKLRDVFNYSPRNNIISNRQEPRRLALERRTHVQNVLRANYGKQVDTNWKGTQWDFWTSNKDCLASVCVPGACNNMLDRGHYELLGLGVCTISPYIPTALPWGKILVPNLHYIMCEDDYSDLVNIIEWCRNDRATCSSIGKSAKDLFNSCATPEKYWEWIDLCIEKFYE